MSGHEGWRYKQLGNGEFGAKYSGPEKPKPGDWVTVQEKSGLTRRVKLGKFVERNKYNDQVFEIESRESKDTRDARLAKEASEANDASESNGVPF